MNDALRILVVDDDQGQRQTLCDVLTAKGYGADAVDCGQAALKACANSQYDLVILDIKLPDIAGDDLAPQIEQLLPNVEIVLITAYASLESAIKSVARCTVDYLLKPIHLDRLLGIVARGAQRRRVAQENARLQQQIHLAKRQWEATFDAILDPVAIVDASGDILRANRAFRRLFGASLTDRAEGKDYEVIFGLRQEPESLLRKEVLRTGARGHAEQNALSIPGAFVIACDPLELGQGPAVVYHLRDISQRKKAEVALSRSEELFRTVIEASKDAFVAVSPDGLITIFNPAAEEMFGRGNQEMIGEPFERLIPEAYRSRHQQFMMHRFAGGQLADRDGETVEFWGLRSNGVEFPIELSISVSSRGSQPLLLAVIRDITARKRAEQEEARLREELHQSQKLRAIGELAGGVSHDFNNLLAGIMGSAELLLEGQQHEGRGRDYLNMIIELTRRGADLTAQLMSFARKGRILSVEIDIHEIVSKVIGILDRTIDKRISVTSQFTAGPHTVLGDPSQLQSAVLNLALNARDAMPQGGELSFQTSLIELDERFCQPIADLKPGNYLSLEVGDTGVGMPADVMDQIFEPFFTTKPEGEGTGLGLASVFGCVKSHQGHITVRSQEGAGTTFTVLLPLMESGQTTAQTPKADQGLVRGTGRILLVDDEELIRGVAVEALRLMGYDVEQCSDGADAVEVFREQHQQIDLVVLDMIMPKLGGLDTFRELKRINPQVKVLLASGFAQDNLIQKALQEGVQGFVQKPFQIVPLSHAVAAAINGTSA